MIKVQKLPEPKHLTANKAAWTAEYIANYHNVAMRAHFRNYYNHKSIRETIVEEAHEKCAYCETKHFLANSYANVEHILPFSRNPSLAFEWLNLVLACTVCNNAKSDYNGEEGHIINPITEEPTEHITFAGPAAFGNTDRGVFTISCIQLNRIRLIEKRTADLEMLNQIVLQFKDSSRTPLQRDLSKEQLKRMIKEDQPYSSARYWFLKLTCPEFFEED